MWNKFGHITRKFWGDETLLVYRVGMQGGTGTGHEVGEAAAQKVDLGTGYHS